MKSHISNIVYLTVVMKNLEKKISKKAQSEMKSVKKGI